MPFLLIPLLIGTGAVAGGGMVWAVNDTAKNLVKAGLVVGAAGLLWYFRAPLLKSLKG